MNINSQIYASTGTESQHHVKWLVAVGLFETAYYKKWSIGLESNGTDIGWLLALVINK